MKLYHGSNTDVRNIDLSKSRVGKDFGIAFYLSDNIEQAQEMAQFKVKTFGGQPIISEFDFDDSILETGLVNYCNYEKYTLEWAQFILKNRNNASRVNLHDFDILHGPIANDKVGRQIFNLQEGYIDIDTFLQRIQYPQGITFQWAFCTPRALDYIKYVRQCK